MKYFMIVIAFFMFLVGAALCYLNHTGAGSVISVGSMIMMMTAIGYFSDPDKVSPSKRTISDDVLMKDVQKYKCRICWYEHFLRIKGFNDQEFVGIDKLVDNEQFPSNKERKPLS